MPGDHDDRLLKQGLLHYKAGEFALARRYLERALDSADDFQTRFGAFFHLALMSDDPARKRAYLEEALAIDPLHAGARRALAILDERLRPEEIIDPDALPAPLPRQAPASAERFTCPKCGGRMVFAPDGQALVCEYCARSQAMGRTSTQEQDFFATMATRRGQSATQSQQVLKCGGCGAEFLLQAQELSFNCAYCGSAQVLRQDRLLAAPDAVIPFGFELEQAGALFHAWRQKQRLPEGSRLGAPVPLYLPAWVFGLAGSLTWRGQVYRKKRLVTVSGEIPAGLEHLAVPASRALPRLLPALVRGYDYTTAVPYDPRYLAGWPAEAHSVSLAEAALEARRLVVARLREEIHAGTEQVQDLHWQTANLFVDTYSLALVPVWLAQVQPGGAGQAFAAALNGASGVVLTVK